MSYYQLISLKIQMGIDPDASIDHKTLLQMWRTHQQKGKKVPNSVIIQDQKGASGASVHYLP